MMAGVRGKLSCIGLVVHPTRDIEEPLHAIRRWSEKHDLDLVQVSAPCEQREVAAHGAADDCDLIVSVGGDGTTLAALRAAAGANRPVLGVGCGSLGVLTSVRAGEVDRALERFGHGDWQPRSLPSLRITREEEEELFALNDVVVVRAGEGQVFVTAEVDGVLCQRFAGDGCIVSTATGSSGYALAAGGPLLAFENAGFVLTPLSAHGGSCPAVVLGPSSELRLKTRVRHGGARLELDGQIVDQHVAVMTVRLAPAGTTVITFDDQEPFLTGLRRRGILSDSPRILAEDASG